MVAISKLAMAIPTPMVHTMELPWRCPSPQSMACQSVMKPAAMLAACKSAASSMMARKLACVGLLMKYLSIKSVSEWSMAAPVDGHRLARARLLA